MSFKLRSEKPATRSTAIATSPNAIIKNKCFVANNKTSPFKSFISTGVRSRRRPQAELNDFAYDLSKDELLFMSNFPSPMKSVPDDQRELLRKGQRDAYLAMRAEHSPNHKYNYPQATSWRIGWLHNQQHES